MTSTKKQGKRIKFWLVIVILCLLGGCMFSPWYHIQVLIGNAEPRPFPIIRYWSEYSSEDFNSEVLAVPFAVPFMMPIGYIGDLCIDTLFFPIDWWLGRFSSESTIEVAPSPNERYTITVLVRSAQLHEDDTLLKGCIPLTVHVQSGSLRITILTGAEEKSTMLITPQRVTLRCQEGYTQSKDIPSAQPLVLKCQPPNYGFPAPLLPSLLEPHNVAPVVGVSTYTEEGRLYEIKHGVSMYKQSTCVISITPSPDFVGECSYNGMPIAEVKFVYD